MGMNFSSDLLKGKVAVVTGAGTGIGRVIAEELSAHGAHLVLTARKLDRLESLAAALKERGGKTLAVSADVSADDQVKNLFERVDAEFGRVDILVNNAAANFIRPSEMLTPVRWRKVVDIVLNGTFYCSLEAGRRMIRQKEGVILNIVASYAWTGGPGLAPSVSAKAGVVALTKTLGVEWAEHGVRVNAIAPGFIDTPQTAERLWPEEWIKEELLGRIPSGRFGTEKDVSNLVLFLSSPMASYITGAVLVADGGESLGQGALKIIRKTGIIRKSRAAA